MKRVLAVLLLCLPLMAQKHPIGLGGSTTTSFPATVTGGVSGGVPCFTSTTTEAASTLLSAAAVVLGGGAGVCPLTSANFTTSGGQLNLGAVGTSGVLGLVGTTSGTATCTAPAIAGTTSNPVTCTNAFALPDGTSSLPAVTFSGALGTGFYHIASGVAYSITAGNTWWKLGNFVQVQSSDSVFGWNSTAGAVVNGPDTGLSRCGAAAFVCVGQGNAQNSTGFIKTGNTVSLSADWTCGTGGIVASCVAATIIGSTATPLTFTLPLVSANWSFECDLVVGQATAATANSWNLLTATNGVTNTTASYIMNTAATAMAGGATTDQASTTTTFLIGPAWTLGGTATKMPVHIAGTLTGVSASGTVVSLQLVAPTVADLVTIYEGSKCSQNP